MVLSLSSIKHLIIGKNINEFNNVKMWKFQDVLNVYFKKYPELLQQEDNRWLFPLNACYHSVPPCCLTSGVIALHGIQNSFIKYHDIYFKASISLFKLK